MTVSAFLTQCGSIGPQPEPVPLFRKVEVAERSIYWRNRRGVLRRLAGVGCVRSRLRTCSARYILDATSSQACLDTLLEGAFGTSDLLDEIRLPSPRFWVEWLCDPNGTLPLKMGAMVESDPTGRSGDLTCFYERPDGIADLVVLQVKFDLDSAPARPRRPDQTRLQHGTLTHLNAILGSALAEALPGWWEFLASYEPDELASEMSLLAENVWRYLPAVLSFANLLASRRAVAIGTTQTIAPKSGTHALPQRNCPDDFAVRMSLEPIIREVGEARSGDRQPARAHQVRGHYVQRGGTRFWRTSHRRGSEGTQIHTRTVYIHGSFNGLAQSGGGLPSHA